MEFINNSLDQIHYTNFYSYINSNLDMIDDLKNQYIQLMSELTKCEDISTDLFYSNIKQISSMGTIIIGYKFISNTKTLIEIVGSGTIIIEPKIIRKGMSIGHIEDIVVKSTYRGKKISQSILNKLKTIATDSNCYKVILDCNESVVQVYKSNGFDVNGYQMSLYF